MKAGWRAAMKAGLYGPGGFFVRADQGPGDHFRTSVHASPLFAGALLRLIDRVDAALGRPKVFDLVDVGAGRGELVATLRPLLPERVRVTAVEVASRPAGLPDGIDWRPEVPDGIVGLLIATEWLDNVPLDVVDLDDAGLLRKVLVEPSTGVESLGGLVDPADLFWLKRWWPEAGRAEIGWPRDAAWADAVGQVRRGCALAIDYGHRRDERPALGTLTGFRGGRQVAPVPDGSCDVTAHVAIDAVAGAAGAPYELVRQREALRALGVEGGRPPLDLARSDPAGYVRALAAAGAEAELIEPAGLGGHWWLLHSIGLGERGSMLS
ncbi:SAM-dependent methyltransferase [Actinoplanes sp. TRM 88003]|uniref:SAM-dependent methyltransferase n=1 Tax=Paractinoplanes aksuensis TaxID=2939490 RepID=A0ABT1DUE9_9ACTN|nr:SAM-dependent methyltransferase [Actinoplanes aksuensis]MCO8274469.1 SAM-dependent methyltransferase [Actinoplanes aksuensis]